MLLEMLTIITPCCRQKNIQKLYESIHFDKIDKWIIIYDTSKGRTYEKLFLGNPKIVEVECDGGISGNPQRNLGLSLVDDGYIYFLDDDNVLHPNFWSIAEGIDNEHFYTFDQLRDNKSVMLYGNRIAVGHIDTAMFLVHRKHIKDIRWRNERYDADGYFICDIYRTNRDKHVYINKTGCYYNYVT